MDIKEKIILKASQLFREKGIKATSMDELASSLGISKRTIYINFEDKNIFSFKYSTIKERLEI